MTSLVVGGVEHDWAMWVWTVFVLVRSLSVIYPPVPGFPMDLLAIRLFGPAFGLGAAECGIMLGATVAFGVARHASPPLSRALLGKWSSVRYLGERLPNGGMTLARQFSKWFELRLFTNPLFDPICYVAGLTSAAFWPYFSGSLVGNLPSTTLFFAAEAVGPIHSVLGSLIVAAMFCGVIIYIADAFIRPPVDEV